MQVRASRITPTAGNRAYPTGIVDLAREKEEGDPIS